MFVLKARKLVETSKNNENKFLAFRLINLVMGLKANGD